MTKKHFIELANVIREIEQFYAPFMNDSHRGQTITAVTEKYREALADFCQSQNPRFNRARWIAYIAGECGSSGGRRK